MVDALVNIFVDGKDIHTWYYEGEQKKYKKITDFQPYFYSSPEDKGVFANIDKLDKHVVKHPSDIKNERSKYKYTYEADVSFLNRYLIDTYYHSSIPDAPVRIAFIDIETMYNEETREFPSPYKAEFPITAITVKDSKTEKTFSFVWHDKETLINTEENIFIYKTEKELIVNFLDFWKYYNFDIVTGWNTKGFDIPFIHNRLQRLKFGNALSPINIVTIDNYESECKIAGIANLDYQEHYKARSQSKKESYKLQNIAQEELGEGKVDFEGSLMELWRNNIHDYIKYNRQDVELVFKLEKKLQYIKLADGIRKIGRCSFDDILYNTKIYDNHLLATAREWKNWAAWTKPKSSKKERIKGAFVGEPEIGIHDWVADLDATALYPSIIISKNISPETNGPMDEQGLIPYVISDIIKRRKDFKEKYKQTRDTSDYMRQWSYKILANSLYGALAYPGFRFYNIKQAALITGTGQEIIKFARKSLEQKGYKPLYSDTDSTFIKLKNIATIEDAKKECKEVQDYVNESLKIIEKEMGIPPGILYFKQEIIARKAMFLQGSSGKATKKRYVLWVVNDEGKDVDEMKYVGVEAIRSDTPRIGRKFLKKFYIMLLKENKSVSELKKYCEDFKIQLRKEAPENIGLPMGISKNIKDYDKGGKIHVTGAKFWNKYFTPKIKGNCKVKYYFIHHSESHVISIPDGEKFPEGIIIDYNQMIFRLVDLKVEKVFDVLTKNQTGLAQFGF